MATDKKHIAVYLAPEVEQALIAFCQDKGLTSKKGTMFSAGVNAALAQFFGIADTRASNTPSDTGNIPVTTGNIPVTTGNIPVAAGNIPVTAGNIPVAAGNIPVTAGNIPVAAGNIPVENLAIGELPGKFQT
jgi:hypothetical protein